MEQRYESVLEALKFLVQWSITLIVIQSGALSVLGALLKGGRKNSVNKRQTLLLKICFIAFITSIFISAHVISAMPPIAQELPELVGHYDDIYRMQNVIGIPLGVLAILQHSFFIIGIVGFGLFIYFFVTKE